MDSCFDALDKLVREKMERFPDCRFVFPSQIAAEFRIRRCLEMGPVKALRKDRFISWDSFKEEHFDEARSEKPVNTALRMLFAEAVLEENSGQEPLFRELIPREYADNSKAYRKQLLSMLPVLNSFLQSLERQEVEGLISETLLEDMRFLNQRYQTFLQAGNLFEPSESLPEPQALKAPALLFFPEVLEDYPEYREALQGLLGLDLISSDELFASGGGSSSRLIRFPSAAAEIHHILDRISRLLDEGIPHSEIAISLADMDQWRDRLEHEAELRSIPLRFHGGRPLSESVPGRFLQAISTALVGKWAVRDLEALVMDRAIPWRSPLLLRRLALFGREYFCHRGADRWESSLKRAGKPVLLSSFTRLRKGCEQLLSSRSFAQLRERVQPFLQSHLDPDLWEPGDQAVLQRSLEALKELEQAEESAGLGLQVAVFPLWLSYLERKQYVPLQEEEGIAVYNYRVAAGINPRYHFLPACGQQKSRVLKLRYPFLSEKVRKALSDGELELSAAFLQLYSRCGAEFSFSEEGFGGPDLAPSELTELEECPGDAGPFDPYLLENAFWRGGRGSLDTLWPRQIDGLKRLVSVGPDSRSSDFCEESMGDAPLQAQALELLCRGRDRLTVSPSMLAAFFACPFSFYADRLLRAREPELSSSLEDPRIQGNLFHRLAARHFSKIGSERSYSSLSETERWEICSEAAREIFSEWRRGHEPVPLEPAAGAAERFVQKAMADFDRAHAGEFGSFRATGTEELLTLEIDDGALPSRLEGRLDWIGRDEEGYLLIDYKKRIRVRKGDLLPGDQSYPASFQIPFYRLLARRTGYGACDAAYFDMTKGAYSSVVSDRRKSWYSREEADRLDDGVEDALYNMLDRLGSGDYRAPQQCDGCSHRGLCRKLFHVR